MSLDLAGVLDEHRASIYPEINTGEPYCGKCDDFAPCDTEQLAVFALDLQGKVARVEALDNGAPMVPLTSLRAALADPTPADG